MRPRFAEQRRTVTLVVRAATGQRDDYNKPIVVEREIDVADCLVAPVASNEDTADADRLVDTATIYNLSGTWPDDSPVHAVRFDGSTWEVNGTPERWPGAIGGVVVQVRKVSG